MRLILLTVFFCMAIAMSVSAEQFVGVILDGYEDSGCKIRNKGIELTCKESRNLFVGDILIHPNSGGQLKIKWAPYAGLRSSKDGPGQEVYFVPPKDKHLVGKLLDFMGFVKSEYRVVLGSTRTAGSDIFKHQIPDGSVLLINQKTILYLPSNTKNIGIFKSNGELVWSISIENDRRVSFVPGLIGMIPGGRYTIRNVSSNKHITSVAIASVEYQGLVDKQFAEIDARINNRDNAKIEKAALLQMISSFYEEVDFLYMSSVLLMSVNYDKLDDDMKLLATNLFIRYEKRLSR